ncbi:hypothetical protein D3C81_110740 [compost metagenome]
MDLGYTIGLPATSFKGLNNNQIIEGSFESGKFEGHRFFNGNWVQAKLLNHYQKYEHNLKNGMRKNQRVKILLEFYEWIPAYGSEATKDHYGINSFHNKVQLFREAGFDEDFIKILNDYSPIECPFLRQWKFLFNFDRRPLVALE